MCSPSGRGAVPCRAGRDTPAGPGGRCRGLTSPRGGPPGAGGWLRFCLEPHYVLLAGPRAATVPTPQRRRPSLGGLTPCPPAVRLWPEGEGGGSPGWCPRPPWPTWPRLCSVGGKGAVSGLGGLGHRPDRGGEGTLHPPTEGIWSPGHSLLLCLWLCSSVWQADRHK